MRCNGGGVVATWWGVVGARLAVMGVVGPLICTESLCVASSCFEGLMRSHFVLSLCDYVLFVS